MIGGREINYAELINRTFRDFRPVKRLWPVGVRLTLWILLSAMIAGIGVAARGGAEPGWKAQLSAGFFAIAPILLATIAAAYLALRSAIPDRAASVAELLLLGVIIVAAPVAAHFAIAVPAESFRAAGLRLDRNPSSDWTGCRSVARALLGSAAWLSGTSANDVWPDRCRGLRVRPPRFAPALAIGRAVRLASVRWDLDYRAGDERRCTVVESGASSAGA